MTQTSRTTGQQWLDIRSWILQRDDHKCQECDCPVGDLDDACATGFVHHKTPVSEGGTDKPSNLVTLCRDCHRDKHGGGTVIPEPPGTGADHPRWKGGRTESSHGYVLVRKPDHPNAQNNGYVYEHRLVAQEKLGRPLREDEHVHHKNGDKTDNRPENLEVIGRTEHRATHHRSEDSDRREPGEPNPTVKCACGCGESFPKYDDEGRPREYLMGHAMKGKERESPTQDAVLRLLKKEPKHRKEIAGRLDKNLNSVSKALQKLRKKGAVEPIGGGVWEAQDD